jgi:hypothetical protein
MVSTDVHVAKLGCYIAFADVAGFPGADVHMLEAVYRLHKCSPDVLVSIIRGVNHPCASVSAAKVGLHFLARAAQQDEDTCKAVLLSMGLELCKPDLVEDRCAVYLAALKPARGCGVSRATPTTVVQAATKGMKCLSQDSPQELRGHKGLWVARELAQLAILLGQPQLYKSLFKIWKPWTMAAIADGADPALWAEAIGFAVAGVQALPLDEGLVHCVLATLDAWSLHAHGAAPTLLVLAKDLVMHALGTVKPTVQSLQQVTVLLSRLAAAWPHDGSSASDGALTLQVLPGLKACFEAGLMPHPVAAKALDLVLAWAASLEALQQYVWAMVQGLGRQVRSALPALASAFVAALRASGQDRTHGAVLCSVLHLVSASLVRATENASTPAAAESDRIAVALAVERTVARVRGGDGSTIATDCPAIALLQVVAWRGAWAAQKVPWASVKTPLREVGDVEVLLGVLGQGHADQRENALRALGTLAMRGGVPAWAWAATLEGALLALEGHATCATVTALALRLLARLVCTFAPTDEQVIAVVLATRRAMETHAAATCVLVHGLCLLGNLVLRWPESRKEVRRGWAGVFVKNDCASVVHKAKQWFTYCCGL